MKIAILLVLVVIALQLFWNGRRVIAGCANVRNLQQKNAFAEQLMTKFGEQRELLKELHASFHLAYRDEDNRTKWLAVEHWKQDAVKHLCEFDFAGALARMTHAVEQAQRLIEDTQSTSPSISVGHVRAFLERQRLGVSLKGAPLEFV